MYTGSLFPIDTVFAFVQCAYLTPVTMLATAAGPLHNIIRSWGQLGLRLSWVPGVWLVLTYVYLGPISTLPIICASQRKTSWGAVLGALRNNKGVLEELTSY